jgi:hypothetical protein
MLLVVPYTVVGGAADSEGLGVVGYKWGFVRTKAKGEPAYLNMGNRDLVGPLPSVQAGGGPGGGQRTWQYLIPVLESCFLEDR